MRRKVHAPDARHPHRRGWTACGSTGQVATAAHEVTCGRCARSTFRPTPDACGACMFGHHRGCFGREECSCECDVVNP